MNNESLNKIEHKGRKIKPGSFWSIGSLLVFLVLILYWYQDYTNNRNAITELNRKIIELDTKKEEAVNSSIEWKTKFEDLQEQSSSLSDTTTGQTKSSFNEGTTDTESTTESTPSNTAVSDWEENRVDFQPINVEGYLSLGSSEEEVKSIMGTPTSINYDSWGYGLSRIQFQNGTVSGWYEIDTDLKFKLGASGEQIEAFSLGSSMQDVIDVMGTPTSINFGSWGYGLSRVRFENGVVTGWNEIDTQLKIK